MKINLYDIMQIICCLGREIMRRRGKWITKGYKETWGDKYVHHLKCGDDSPECIHMLKVIKL